MRKVTDFIIDNRYKVLVVFIILSIVSVFLSTKVNINHDISKYLPSDSETRIGMDIMETKLKELKSSSFNLMFKGLDLDEKKQIYEELKDISSVDSVSYDDTDDYNRDDYTLYVVNVSDTDDSIVAKEVYEDVVKKYEDYEVYTSGDVASSNEAVLPTWIVVLAVFCALVILIVMCSSYVEPFLFLSVILIAVLLNSGTNIMFDSVSNITSSISAILQMALSMDYSIMLMNRYNQEKKKEHDKVKAMKEALSKAFTSISSSSITTIVGLLALVFMSFTIGRDLGFVLAKGVLLSLVAIFTCLPALILIFDKQITKTQKRSPNIKLDWLGKFSYKIRYISIFIFILVFAFSFLTKGNLKILYTENEEDKIKDVFQINNQMAVVYKNEDEKIIADYCKKLEKKEGVDSVLCYANTIGEKLQYSELNTRIKDLGSNMDVDSYLLKILFYNYYNQDEKNKMTFNEFISFVQQEVYENEEMNDKLDDTTKSNIERLSNFTDIDSINKQRSANEIASILEIDADSVMDILVYYNSLNKTGKMTLQQFVSFMNGYVLDNEKYGKNIDSNTRSSLETLTKFVDVNVIRSKNSSLKQANLFGLAEGDVKDLYLYYVTQNEVDIRMTINSFADFVSSNVLTDPLYKNNFDDSTKQNINTLKTFSDIGLITKNMTSTDISFMFGLDENMVKQVLYLKYSTTDNNTKMTLGDFVTTVYYLKSNTTYLNNVDVSGIINLINNPQIMSDSTLYTASEVATILNTDKGVIYNLYALIDLANNNTNSWNISPYDFVNLVLASKDKTSINQDSLNKLYLLSNVMNSAINNVSFNYRELSSLIGIDDNTVKSIYSLYLTNCYGVELSPQEFVSFILNHKNDSVLAGKLNRNTLSQLELLNNIMNASSSNRAYSVDGLANLLGMDSDSISLIFALYDYRNSPTNISLKEIVNFLLENVVTNDEYSKNFDNVKIDKLNTINAIMNASMNGVKYTKNEMFGILTKLADSIDSEMIDLLYIYYGSENEYNDNWKLTICEFVDYLNDTILKDERFNDFIDSDMRRKVGNAKKDIGDAKDLLVGDGYSRMVINTKLEMESDQTFDFIKDVQNELKRDLDDVYLIGNSPMAYDMSKSFNSELDFITILTMIAIFVVVAVTFKSIIIPIILVFLIQCAVYLTMGILSFTGGNVYFIALLIVQSILMGATIDYAILYTSYYIEHRKMMNVKNAIINSYNKSIHTILTSASILIIVTLIVGCFASAIAAKICKTLSEGTLCAALLILILLPAILAMCDKLIIKKENKK